MKKWRWVEWMEKSRRKKDDEERKRKRKSGVYIWRWKAAVSAKAAVERSRIDTSQSIMENGYFEDWREIVDSTIVLL